MYVQKKKRVISLSQNILFYIDRLELQLSSLEIVDFGLDLIDYQTESY